MRIDLGIDGNSGNGISCNGPPLLNNTQQRGQIPLSANGELISIMDREKRERPRREKEGREREERKRRERIEREGCLYIEIKVDYINKLTVHYGAKVPCDFSPTHIISLVHLF